MSLPNPFATDLTPGAPLPQSKQVITREMIWRYGEMVEGDRRNPLHYDQGVAVEAGYPDIIAHGTLSLGFVSRSLAQALGAPWLTGSKISAKFIGAVFPGDEITVHGVLRERVTEEPTTRLVFEYWCQNQHGQKVIVGKATVLTQAE